MNDVAVLYAQKRSIYKTIPGCDVYDEERDAFTFAGDLPVVAHPPCQTWCRLAGFVEFRWGKKRGEDGGTFAHALEQVRRNGGVLEHPAFSDAWTRYELALPGAGGWQQSLDGSWVTHVEQYHYGHKAKKATWLYYVGDIPPPPLRWKRSPDSQKVAMVSWAKSFGDGRPRVTKKEASATPIEFAHLLVGIARQAYETA